MKINDSTRKNVGELKMSPLMFRLILNTTRRNDLAFALSMVEEITPSPARAHTALVVLRDTICRISGFPDCRNPNSTPAFPSALMNPQLPRW